MAFTYYKHIESNEGGRNAAILDAAERRISAIDGAIEELTLEKRYHEGVIRLIGKSVCKRCNGEGTVTYYPAGTGPGQGARSSIPCPECHSRESKAKQKELDRQYRGY